MNPTPAKSRISQSGRALLWSEQLHSALRNNNDVPVESLMGSMVNLKGTSKLIMSRLRCSFPITSGCYWITALQQQQFLAAGEAIVLCLARRSSLEGQVVVLLCGNSIGLMGRVA